MGIEMLVYCPLLEEESENVTGWSKATIAYIIKHRAKVYAQIRGIAKSFQKRPLQSMDVEEIYSNITLYLHNSSDYNISKAIERSHTDSIVTLEGYLNTCIKYCVRRFCTATYKVGKGIISDVINEDGEELSLLDSIADAKSNEHMDSVMYDLESICKSCESLRYRYGPDIYLLWYVRLLTEKSDLYKNVLNILGITKKELSIVEKKAEDELMLTIAKAIELCGTEKALQIIKPYVFSASKIEEAILHFNR